MFIEFLEFTEIQTTDERSCSTRLKSEPILGLDQNQIEVLSLV